MRDVRASSKMVRQFKSKLTSNPSKFQSKHCWINFHTSVRLRLFDNRPKFLQTNCGSSNSPVFTPSNASEHHWHRRFSYCERQSSFIVREISASAQLRQIQQMFYCQPQELDLNCHILEKRLGSTDLWHYRTIQPTNVHSILTIFRHNTLELGLPFEIARARYAPR